jgi:hypothetical protein
MEARGSTGGEGRLNETMTVYPYIEMYGRWFVPVEAASNGCDAVSNVIHIEEASDFL